MSKQLTINGEILLLCERLEMARFLHVYLQYLFRQGVSLPTLQLLNYRSLEQLSSLAERLPHIAGSKQVQKVIVFADAQNDLENRRNVLLDLRSSAFFRTREYCAHFFFPGRQYGRRWRHGYLEDLLLETLKIDASKECDFQNLLNMAREYLVSVEQMRKFVQDETDFKLKLEKKSGKVDFCDSNSFKLTNPSRHLLYTYFAGTEQFVGCNLAEAAKLGAFDFEHEAYAELKKCLLGLGLRERDCSGFILAI